MSGKELAPRIPLYEGRSIKVFLESDAHEASYLGFRAGKGHRFTSPKTSSTLYLPYELIFSVAVVPLEPPEWASLKLHGDFREGELPDDIVFAPVAAEDATAIAALLTERLKLPRKPEPIYPERLTRTGSSQLQAGDYIRVVGCYRPSGHFEGPNFEGVQLRGTPAQLTGLVPGKRYAVTGYYGAGLGDSDVRPTGWSGRSLAIRTIQPEPDGPRRSPLSRYDPPLSPFRRGPLWAWLHAPENRGHEQLEFSTRLDPETRIIAALDGQGGDRSGDWAARVGLLTLATLIPEPFYQPFLDAPAEPTPEPRNDWAAWVAWLVDRSPLPSEAPALLAELCLRIGKVLEELNLRGYAMGLGGVLALLKGRRVTLLRRGLARTYLLRNGQLRVLLHEDTLERQPGFDATPEVLAAIGGAVSVPVSLFTPQDAFRGTPPLQIEVQPGDRLIFALGGVILKALGDSARERLLAGSVPNVLAGMPATQDMEYGGFGVVSVEIGRCEADGEAST